MRCHTLNHECLTKKDSHAEWKCETPAAWHHSIHYKLLRAYRTIVQLLCMRGPHITMGSPNP